MGDGLPICRICLKTAMEFYDFDMLLEEKGFISYRESFNLLTQLNAMENDKLPQNLCYNCSVELKFVDAFIQKAKNSDKILREKIANDTSFSIITQEGEFDHDDVIKLEESNETHKEDVIVFELEEGHSSAESEEIVKAEEYEIPKDVEENYVQNEEDGDGEEEEEEENLQDINNLTVKDENLKNGDKPKRNKTLLLCNICGKTCSQKSSLQSHLLKHKGERPFKCDNCDKTYFTKNGLQMHMIVHSEDGPTLKFECEFCGKAFATAQRLRIHKLTHTGEKDYECKMCSKKFGTQFRLRTHLRTHTGERPYICKVCGLRFAQNNALHCHMRRHTGEKPYECNICGKRFLQNTTLKTHMTLHTGKTVQCPNCDKKFSRPSYLILHQREHTGEKPYACDKCPNRYRQKSHLDRHLDTHLGIKHTCDKCGKEYSKKSSLKVHMFTHLKEKPFHCEICSISFTRRDKFKIHLNKQHDKTLVNNEVTDLLSYDDIREEVEDDVEESETAADYIAISDLNSVGDDIVHTVLIDKSFSNISSNRYNIKS